MPVSVCVTTAGIDVLSRAAEAVEAPSAPREVAVRATGGTPSPKTALSGTAAMQAFGVASMRHFAPSSNRLAGDAQSQHHDWMAAGPSEATLPLVARHSQSDEQIGALPSLPSTRPMHTLYSSYPSRAGARSWGGVPGSTWARNRQEHSEAQSGVMPMHYL